MESETFWIICIFSLVAIGVIAYGYFNAENRAKKLREIQEEEQKLLSSLGAVSGDDFSKMKEDSEGIDPKLSTGETDLYKWTQEASDIEMYIKVDNETNRKDVKCNITSTSIKLMINDNTVIEDKFYAEVDTDECNWQLDGDNDERLIWLTIQKKIVTIRKNHWPYILQNDADSVLKGFDASNTRLNESNMSTFTDGSPPVYNINTDNKEAMRAVINKIKKNNENVGLKN